VVEKVARQAKKTCGEEVSFGFQGFVGVRDREEVERKGYIRTRSELVACFV